MQLLTLGHSDLKVSEICLGTMYFGTKTDQSQSEAILNVYLEKGGNFVDTANNYAFWMEGGVGDESEAVIGKWLKNQARDKVILATKCGARPSFYTGDLETIQLEGLGYETIIKTVEASLERLQTDYVDLLYGHIDFEEYPVEERLEAFWRLKKEGKVRAIGTSNTRAWRLEESRALAASKGEAAYCAVQQKYSYLRPKANADFWVQKLISDELLSYARHRPEITLLAYSTLLSGLYANVQTKPFPPEYDTADNCMRVSMLEEVARESDCTLNQLVLAWMRHHEVEIIPLISGSKVAQIEESIRAVDIKLTSEQMARLDGAGE